MAITCGYMTGVKSASATSSVNLIEWSAWRKTLLNVKNLEHRLQEMASHDELTGIMNRCEGNFILEKLIDLSKRLKLQLGISLFDLDHLKNINDQHDISPAIKS